MFNTKNNATTQDVHRLSPRHERLLEVETVLAARSLSSLTSSDCCTRAAAVVILLIIAALENYHRQTALWGP